MDEFYVSEFGEKIYSLSKESLYSSKSKSNPSVYVTVLSTFIVRSGIFLAQVSSIPSSNMQVLILQNFLDISMNTVTFCFLGYMFAFGNDFYNFIGAGTFLNENSNMNDFAMGWMIIIIVSGLLTSAVGDRISLFASLTLNFLISGFTFPVIIHWVLSESGWMQSNILNDIKVSYRDYNYSAVIHMSGGFVSFLGLIVLNRRLLLFRNIDVSSIPDNGPSLTMFGYLMMILGLIGLSMPNEKIKSVRIDDFNGITLVNTILSLFGSILSALISSFIRPCEPVHKWTGLRYIQSGVSGIAVIAGGADVYYPLISLVIGFINGFIFSLVTMVTDRSSMEDYCKITAVHFVSGLIGTLLPRLLDFRYGYKNNVSEDFLLLAWQLLCDCVILAFLTVIFVPILLVLDRIGILRTFDEYVNHHRAKSVRKSASNFFATKPDGYLEPGYRKRLQPDKVDSRTEIFFERTDRFFEADLRKDKNFVVNYIINSAPKIFFEELQSEPETNKKNGFFKGCGDVIVNNLQKVHIKKINSLKNISDSKLFQRFKEAIPKKIGPWKKGKTIPFRSASIPSFSDFQLNLETQV